MGNILFLLGITLLLGPQRTFLFFARRNKWRGITSPIPQICPLAILTRGCYLTGSAAFWTGILLILLRWTLIGFACESYGIFPRLVY